MAEDYRIDNHKLIFHPQRVAQWEQGHNNWEEAKKIYPIYLEISPVGYCNHRCVFCAKDYIGYKHRKIPYEILKNRISEMAELGVKSIMFAGEGESTLYKELPELIEHCTNVGIDTALTTNIVPFTEKSTDVYVKHCKWIKVSINAGNAETYTKIHGTSEKDFDIAINNMKLASSIKKEKNYSCTLGAQMLLLPDNFDTALELAKEVQNLGFDYLVIKPYSQHLSSVTHTYENIDYSKYVYLERELQSFNSDDFKVIFRSHTINKLLNDQERYSKCNAVPFFWGYIMANGEVYGCSSFLENEKFCYGNINEKTSQEVWEGDKRKESYEFIRNKMNAQNCRENCRMDEINRYLWELDHPSAHVNFI
ncbi:MAG: radical SAM protein [Candidatus Melainabacteria bacterium GWF2_32_7]|nr:MAG: radical SAM protein [Candidatus Melainabacteria bacterium GWF2_32_7]